MTPQTQSPTALEGLIKCFRAVAKVAIAVAVAAVIVGNLADHWDATLQALDLGFWVNVTLALFLAAISASIVCATNSAARQAFVGVSMDCESGTQAYRDQNRKAIEHARKEASAVQRSHLWRSLAAFCLAATAGLVLIAMTGRQDSTVHQLLSLTAMVGTIITLLASLVSPLGMFHEM